MAATLPLGRQQVEDQPASLLGGYAALAEGAWMGAAQASEVLDPARAARRAAARLHPRRLLSGLFGRELGVAEATVILMASFFCSALLGAVRQILFNAQFGTGPEATAYYAAFRLPDMLFSLVAGGALSGAMIPVVVATTRTNGEAAGSRLVSLVLTTLLAVFACIVCVGELVAPAFVRHVLAPGFDAGTSHLTVTLTRLMLIQPLILAVGSVATAVLNSRGQFALTALSVTSHNLWLIAGIVASRLVPSLGIYGPTLGVVACAALQAMIVLPGLLARERRYRPVWNITDTQLREVIRLLIPNGLAVGVGYAGFIVDTAFASKAPEAAGLAALQNAWLLVGLPVALLGQAIGQAAFPRLAAHAAEQDWATMRGILLRSLGAAICLAVPALIALLLLGRPAIHIIFEHGKFDTNAGSLTYALLVPYALGLPAYVGTELLSRGLVALRDTRTPLLTNSAQLAVRAGLMALLLGVIGVVAIPAAFAGAAFLETLALGTVLLLKLNTRLQVSVQGIG